MLGGPSTDVQLECVWGRMFASCKDGANINQGQVVTESVKAQVDDVVEIQLLCSMETSDGARLDPCEACSGIKVLETASEIGEYGAVAANGLTSATGRLARAR